MVGTASIAMAICIKHSLGIHLLLYGIACLPMLGTSFPNSYPSISYIVNATYRIFLTSFPFRGRSGLSSPYGCSFSPLSSFLSSLVFPHSINVTWRQNGRRCVVTCQKFHKFFQRFPSLSSSSHSLNMPRLPALGRKAKAKNKTIENVSTGAHLVQSSTSPDKMDAMPIGISGEGSQVYLWAWGNLTQTIKKHGARVARQRTPKLVETLETAKIKSVSANGRHICVVTR